jgi:hypothetical protein
VRLPEIARRELAGDLVLADYLLICEIAEEVRFHLKTHPTFVSDAMGKDVRQAIEFLAASSLTATSILEKRLGSHLESGRLQLSEHFFWNRPLAM